MAAFTPSTKLPAAGTPSTLQRNDLFATRIWQAQLAWSSEQIQRWISTILQMRAASPEPAGRTNRHGWNSKGLAVLEDPIFAELHVLIRAGCSDALGEMGVPDMPFGLQSWVNMHDRGGFNFLHVHEGCLLSGSVYLQVPPGSGRLVFRDPRPGVIHGYVKGAVPNGHRDIHLTPRDGLLVLFPCWMEHYVEPHDNDEPRIVIAFNAINRA